MAVLQEYWMFILPVALLQLALTIFSVVHVLRHPHYRFGNKALWLFIVIMVNFIGPAFYFLFGRGERDV